MEHVCGQVSRALVLPSVVCPTPCRVSTARMSGWLSGGSSREYSPLSPLSSCQSSISSSELSTQSSLVITVAAGTSADEYSVECSGLQVAKSGVATPCRYPPFGVSQAKTWGSRKEIHGGISRRNLRRFT